LTITGVMMKRSGLPTGSGRAITIRAPKGARKAPDIAAALRSRFTSPSYNPPVLPAIALEVHKLAQHPSADLTKMVAVIEKDPLLAARVLRLAHSAASAPASAIPSVRDAVVRIGLRNVADVAWEVALATRVFRSKSYSKVMALVSRHSIACAHLSRLVAGFTSIATEYAFLCGLLHDVGMAAALVILETDSAGAPLSENECADVLGTCHEEASHVVAALWKLPSDIQIVLGCHHSVLAGPFVHPLAAVVATAEQLARQLGHGMLIGNNNCDATTGAALVSARHALRIDDKQMDSLRTQAAALMESLAPAGVQ
jgi:HD-like signal output (HDOD) protein